jgi:SAM-dependent MidA family methyltransferase
MSHPAFGTLIARQLEQMWRLLGEPRVFHVIEVGAGDGSLAESIVHACCRIAPGFAHALYYVAADYEPRRPRSSDAVVDWDNGAGVWSTPGAIPEIQRVKTDGLSAFRNVVGCILSNELVDNFPVHRFAIQHGSVKEVFVTLVNGNFTEVLDEPSSSLIADRIAGLGLSLPEGYRGEVNLALEDWSIQVSRALDRGFALTIDYGEHASDLYSAANEHGTLVCYRRHAAGSEPYQDVGEQDITCHVDFTSLMRLGEAHGLTTVGYTVQREFLANLGFSELFERLDAQGQSAARAALNRIAMHALVDPQDYGDLKVLAQAKGVALPVELLGFARR